MNPVSSTLALVAESKSLVAEGLVRIREHPFIEMANRGELSRAQALRWIFCAGRESRTFPGLLEGLIEHTQNPKVSEILRDNLADEMGNGNPEAAHYTHYLHLLDKLGVSREDFDGYNEQVGIRLAVSLAHNIAQARMDAVALGYMMINEAITPVSYDAARVALTRYFPDLRTDFFRMHVEVDELHLAELYEAAEELDEASIDDLKYGIGLGERGMAVLLDEAYGMFDHHRLVSV